MISPARQQLPLANIPQMNHLVRATGSQKPTVRADRQAANFSLMFSQDMQALAGLGIPNVNRLSRIGTGQRSPIRTKSERRHLVAMTVEQDNRPKDLRVPNPSGCVPTTRNQAMTLRMPSQSLEPNG